VPTMPCACLGHWYLSLLYLAPVATVVAGLAVLSKLERRRGRDDEATETAEPTAVGS
jgi:cytochrome c-type biogenesis protein CcmH/NrfF